MMTPREPYLILKHQSELRSVFYLIYINSSRLLFHFAILIERNGIAGLIDRLGEQVPPDFIPGGPGKHNRVGAAAVVVDVAVCYQST